MKAVICLCALVVVAIARPEEQYTNKYDDVDVGPILDNDRLLDGYVDCFMDRGKCTPQANEIKSHIPDALENHCAKCTPKQKDGIRLVMKHLINNKPNYWKELCAKYDPEGKYTKKYEEELKTVS